MTQDLKNRLKRTFILVLIALCVGAGIGFYQVSQDNSGGEAGHSGGFTISKMSSVIGGGFSLVNDEGRAVTEADYPGYKLMYFGFTYCPAVCPTELRKMSQALEILGDKAEAVQPLFITVDPERDTAEAMQSYVELFHPRLVGLTGSQEQIDAVKEGYRVYSAKVFDEDDPEEYTVDHSSYIYFMSPENQLISMFHARDDAAGIAAAISKVVAP